MGFFDGVSKEVLENAPEGGIGFKVGDNPCRIKEVQERYSATGKDMLVITFEKRDSGTIKWYIANGDFKLKSLKNLMESFEIPLGNCNIDTWIGRRGVAVCKEGKPYNGKVYPAVSYCKHLDDLNTGSGNSRPNNTDASPAASKDGFTDDIPF